ncbi:MAG: hypothetical protein SFZ24_02720 [Planctomycetota bacterium]|nr:hypothetical protein [Planctomycetota bacterium]
MLHFANRLGVVASAYAVMMACATAAGQTPFGLNIDVDFNFPGEPGTGVPAASFAGAGGQAGVWSNVSFGLGPVALKALDGSASGATMSRSVSPALLTLDLGGAGDYARLIYDADRIDGPLTYTIAGLPAGRYTVFTYAAAPTVSTVATRVTINGEPQTVASAPTTETFVLGATHARHNVVHPGGALAIVVDKASINGVVNGFQVVPFVEPPPQSFALVSPANGATGVALTPTVSWSASANATSYRLMVDNEPGFAAPVLLDTVVTGTAYAVPAGALSEGTQYWWRVVASNASGTVAGTPDPSVMTTATAPPPPAPPPVAINVDIDFPFPGDPATGAPSTAYGAASGQPGTWNRVGFGTGPFALTQADGGASGVRLSRSSAPASFGFDIGLGGDYALLVYDADRIDGPLTYTFQDLPAGTYDVYSYAAAPTFGTVATRVSIGGVAQTVAAAPTNGSFALGATHAKHTVVHAGGNLAVTVDKASLHGAINGFQLVPFAAAQAVISEPGPCTVESGLVEVRGTASGAGLRSWTLEYTGGGSSTWATIASGTAAVNGALLAAWDTTGLAACGYTLRLRVDTGGPTPLETLRSLVLAARGDGNLSGQVNFEDLTTVLQNFNATGP